MTNGFSHGNAFARSGIERAEVSERFFHHEGCGWHYEDFHVSSFDRARIHEVKQLRPKIDPNWRIAPRQQTLGWCSMRIGAYRKMKQQYLK